MTSKGPGARSTSFRVEKRTATQAQGEVGHVARTGLVPGRHSNKEIDPSRTQHNVVKVVVEREDGTLGLQRTQRGPARWRARQKELLAQVDSTVTRKDGTTYQRKTRADAVAVVDSVMQLDPEWTGTSEELLRPENAAKKAEVERLLEVMAKTYATEVAGGWKNVIGYSIQWDETNPHLHMASVPLTAERRLDHKKFIRGPKHLPVLHDKFRTALREQGYEATFERVNRGKPAEELKTYKAAQDERKEVKEAARAEGLAEGRQQAAQELQEVRESLLREQEELEAKQAAQEAKEAALRLQEAKARDVVEKAEESRHALRCEQFVSESPERVRQFNDWLRQKKIDEQLARDGRRVTERVAKAKPKQQREAGGLSL